MKGRTKMSAAKRRNYIFCYLMISVAVINFIIFYVVKNFNAIMLAFKQVDYFDENGFVHYKLSLGNFTMFFEELKNTQSDVFIAVKNTLKYFSVNTFVIFPISYVIAYFLYKKIWGYKIYRVIFFLTTIISSVVLVTIFKNIIRGPLPDIVESLTGYEMPSLLTHPDTATNTIIVYCIWTGLAGNFLLFQGAMNRIPEELNDALQIDGCGWVRELLTIVTPLCWQTMSTLLITNMVGIFSASGPILLFNTGGKFDTWTLSYWIYEQVMGANYAYPAAIGLFFAGITMPFILLVRKLLSIPFSDLEY